MGNRSGRHPTPRPPGWWKRRVLVIDDDPQASMLTRVVLEDLGHDVIEVGNGRDALKQFREFQPHVVLIDLRLPGERGEEIASSLRSEDAAGRARLVALTGYDEEDVCEASTRPAFDAFATRPGSLGELEQALRRLVEGCEG